MFLLSRLAALPFVHVEASSDPACFSPPSEPRGVPAHALPAACEHLRSMLAYFTARAQEEYTSTRPRGTGFQWRCRPTVPIRLSSMRSASSPMAQSWIARAVLQTLRPFAPPPAVDGSTLSRYRWQVWACCTVISVATWCSPANVLHSSICTHRRRVQTAAPWVGCCAAQRSAPICFSAECLFHNCAAVMLMTECRALFFAAELANTEVCGIQQDAKFFPSPGTTSMCFPVSSRNGSWREEQSGPKKASFSVLECETFRMY